MCAALSCKASCGLNMGYYIEQTESLFVIKKDNIGKALVKMHLELPENAPCTMCIKDEETFKGAMRCWRYDTFTNMDGDITEICFTGTKMGSCGILFNVIAPYVESGSYIQFMGEGGEYWRYVFSDGEMTEEWGGLVW